MNLVKKYFQILDKNKREAVFNGDVGINYIKDIIYPKISVITPSYNQGLFIEETINSVLKQNYPNLEYIIIDGGSTDSTKSILEKYDKSITYWVSEKDNGQSDAINKGFALATGDILCWLNSDDTYLPNTLHKVAKYFLQSNTFNKIISGRGYYLFEANNIVLNNGVSELYKKCDDIEFCYHIIQPSTFWGKSVMKKNGNVKENLHYCFDWEWFIRANEKNIVIQKVGDYFSYYRIHKDHKSSTKDDKRLIELSKLCSSLHGKDVGLAYIKLNRSNKDKIFRRLLRRLPSCLEWVKLIHWRLKFSNVTYKTYSKLLFFA